MLIAMVVLPIAIVVIHLVFAYFLGKKRTSTHSPFAHLVGLTIATTAMWMVVAYPFAYFAAECCFEASISGEPFESILYSRTLGLPFSLCYIFPQFGEQIGSTLCGISQLLLLPTALFMLGVPVFALARSRSKSYHSKA